MTNDVYVVRRLLGLIMVVVLLAPCTGLAGEAAPRRKPLEAGPRLEPAEPVSAEALEGAIDRGVEFLLKRQNKDGSWGSHFNTKGLNIYAPAPGAHHAFRTGTTSLCISALIETGSDREDVSKAIDRGEAWMFERLPKLRRATPDAIYNTWGHAYSIQTLVRMLGRHAEDDQKLAQIRRLIDSQIDLLGRYECVDGGWCYYDFDYGTKQPGGSSISFVSAAVLVAFYDAKQVGVEVPQRLVDRAVESIRRQRRPDFSYVYGEYLKYAAHPINKPGGSLGRSQACNVAMRFWDDVEVTDRVLTVWLDRLFARNGWLSIGRKRPVPHEAWFSVAGYFYYFGHYYAGLCIEQLAPSERSPYQDHLARTLMDLQEKDGCWWDYPLYDYHQQYGTAYAIMSLVRCRRPSEE